MFFKVHKIALHLDPVQLGTPILGTKLWDQVGSLNHLGQTELDWLLAHPELIPVSWQQDAQGRERYIYFWGTLQEIEGRLYVTYLCFVDNQWQSHLDCLLAGYNDQNPAAIWP